MKLKRKTVFEPCRHRGFGKFCHLCRQLERGELVEKGGKFVVPKKDIKT